MPKMILNFVESHKGNQESLITNHTAILRISPSNRKYKREIKGLTRLKWL